jgi:hypothetical protein
MERKERAQEAYRTASPSPTKPSALPQVDYDALQRQGTEAVLQGATATASYAQGVLGSFLYCASVLLRYSQKPLGAFLFIYLISYLGLALTSHLRSAVLAPICSVPGAPILLPICSRVAPSTPSATPGVHLPAQRADFPSLTALEEHALAPLLSNSAGGSALSLELKRAELATTDLITLVRVSRLTSRELIATSLSEFVDDAKKAGRGLQSFNAKVSGAVDNVLAINDYALQQIAAAPESSVFSALNPWRKTRDDVAVAEFGRAMDVLSTQLARLVLEAEMSMAQLGSLEERLASLHEILAREDAVFTSELDDLLASLWTLLGGNRAAVRSARINGLLLRELGSYRKRARAHVAGALQTLQGMEADMSELRARVAAPALLGEDVPVEVHMKAIQAGVERLKEGRVKAKEMEAEMRKKTLEAAEQ